MAPKTKQAYIRGSILCVQPVALVCLVTALVGLVVTGCGFGSASTPTPSAVAAASPRPTSVQGTRTTGAEPTAEPSSVLALPATVTASATALAATTASIAPPTPNAPPTLSCGPPAGWVAHIVQPGDTLYDLAINTNTTIEEIQQANCMEGRTTIFDGETLYIPFEPGAPPTTPPDPTEPATVQPTAQPTLGTAPTTEPATVQPTEQATVQPTEQATVQPSAVPCQLFDCQDDGQPPLALAVGGGNDATFTPCANSSDTPWIDTRLLNVELGELRYFFACNFASNPIAANIVSSNGLTQTVQLLQPGADLDLPPKADLPRDNAQAVIPWPALPDQPTGVYTLTITADDGTLAQLRFLVKPASRERILIVPQAGPPGKTFEVYFLGIDLSTPPTFDFYAEDTPSTTADHTLLHRGGLQVPITQPYSLMSATTNRQVAYAIGYDNKRVTALFWLR